MSNLFIYEQLHIVSCCCHLLPRASNNVGVYLNVQTMITVIMFLRIILLSSFLCLVTQNVLSREHIYCIMWICIGCSYLLSNLTCLFPVITLMLCRVCGSLKHSSSEDFVPKIY
ncbi:hypothetical protein Droror1_Dr00002924 [Drosera rotundifolia]